MRLDLSGASKEERHQLRRLLDEALTDQIEAGATAIEIEAAPLAYDEVIRLHVWSDVREFPEAIIVTKPGGTAA